MYEPDNPTTQNDTPPVDIASRSVGTPPSWADFRLTGLMEPGLGEGCLPGKSRDAAAPGDDNFTSPNHKLFHTCTAPRIQGRTRTSLGSIPPRKVRKVYRH